MKTPGNFGKTLITCLATKRIVVCLAHHDFNCKSQEMQNMTIKLGSAQWIAEY